MLKKLKRQIKRLVILQLAIIVLFSFITVLASATSNEVPIPQGPLSHDENTGIQQIMDAGVLDQNFAKAIYNSFVSNDFYGDETQNIREILGEFEGGINACDYSIKDITGIEWLRKAQAIDFSNSNYDETTMNTFTDLTPLTVDYITNKLGASYEEAKRWFRNITFEEGMPDEEANLQIKLNGVPFTNYGLIAGHSIVIIEGGNTLPTISSEDLVAIKDNSIEDWSTKKSVNLPEITSDNKRVYFWNDPNLSLTKIDRSVSTINDDAYLEYDKIEDDIFEVANIKDSGYLRGVLVTRIADGVTSFKYVGSSGGSEAGNSTALVWQTSFYTRIYMPIVAEKEVKTSIKVTKSATCDESGKKVVGAKYYLYKDNGDLDYENDGLATPNIYVTDENGEFYVNETLENGNYYLKEFEAPEGFLINENPIKFSITADQTDINVSGGDTDFEVNAGNIEKKPNTVYFDRYSDDVNVEINVDSNYINDPNYKLEKLEISYYDRNTHKEETITVTGPDETKPFDSYQDAANWINQWINTNRGNEKDRGIFDGQISIKAQFNHLKELTTSDARPTTDIKFTKLGQDIDEEGNLKTEILPNATFKMTCTHKHTDDCKDINGNITYASCSDPHSDCGDYFTNEGCNWNNEAISDENGVVNFINVNTGTYEMTEIKTPEGYLPTETVWEVEVDAIEGTYTIKEKSQDGKSEIQGNQEDGYKIINESYFVKVVKVDSESNQRLPGATFGLYKQDENGEWGKEPIQTVTTKEISSPEQEDGGFAVFENLDEGKYKIKELIAPPGYELISEEVVFELPFKYVSESSGVNSEVTADQNVITFTISNNKGFNLPMTGAGITARIAMFGILIMGITTICLRKTVRKDV